MMWKVGSSEDENKFLGELIRYAAWRVATKLELDFTQVDDLVWLHFVADEVRPQ